MKKLYSFLLAILVSTTLQAYDACIDGIYYNLFNDKAEVTCEYYSFSSYYGDVIIPETIRYEGKEYTVTIIGNQAFMSPCCRHGRKRQVGLHFPQRSSRHPLRMG